MAFASHLQIDSHRIGPEAPPYVIAELSANHNGSLERALNIVDAAADAGAHALKLQTYTADTMTLDLRGGEFSIDDPNSLWHGYSLYELYDKAHTPWDWHKPIFDRCRELGLSAFSSPFDDSAVEFLESLNCPAYKIASFENVDIPLIRRVAQLGKPMVISTGMASVDELEEAVTAVREAGCRELMLLKCTSTYPAPAEESNLRTISDLQERFGCPVGLSDHTPGIGVAVASVALGGVAIEKHVTLARADGGFDAAFSLEPDELAALVRETTAAWNAGGAVHYGPTDRERGSLVFRRSLYFVEDVPRGTQIEAHHVRAIRPGSGLPPKYREDIIGRTAAVDIKRGTPVSWDTLVEKDGAREPTR